MDSEYKDELREISLLHASVAYDVNLVLHPDQCLKILVYLEKWRKIMSGIASTTPLKLKDKIPESPSTIHLNMKNHPNMDVGEVGKDAGHFLVKAKLVSHEKGEYGHSARLHITEMKKVSGKQPETPKGGKSA